MVAAAHANGIANAIGRYIGYALVLAAAYALFRSVRSGRFKAGLMRAHTSSKAEAAATSLSGARADVGGVHVHLQLGGVSANDNHRGADHNDRADDHDIYLPADSDLGRALRRLAQLPTGDGAGHLPDADRSADGFVPTRAAGRGGRDNPRSRLTTEERTRLGLPPLDRGWEPPR